LNHDCRDHTANQNLKTLKIVVSSVCKATSMPLGHFSHFARIFPSLVRIATSGTASRVISAHAVGRFRTPKDVGAFRHKVFSSWDLTRASPATVEE
jgi:hypothetical protein